MKSANLELVKPLLGTSFTVKHYLESNENEKASFWHFHPEIELVFVRGGNGIRHVGNHMSYYEDGDLVLIGSNLPHNGFTDRYTGNSEEVVVQFLEDFVGKQFWETPETAGIKELFSRSLNGVVFKGKTKRKVGNLMKTLAGRAPFQRMLSLLEILHVLAESTEYKVLNASTYTIDINASKNQRASNIFTYVRKNYQSAISLSEIASVSAMTVPSFCRYFKNLTDKTFTQFLNEYRIIEACRMLTETDYPIGEVSVRVGFNSIAHFNKHFKQMTSNTPKEYRKLVQNSRSNM